MNDLIKKSRRFLEGQKKTVWISVVMVMIFVWIKPVGAQVSNISYTFSPAAERLYWSGNAGLKDGNVFGGSIGLGFGEFVQLNGLYFFGNDFSTDFNGFSNADSTFLQNIELINGRNTKLKRFGGSLRLNLSRGNLVPFVTVGTGLIRFEPEGLDNVESIYLSGGVGVMYSIADRYTLSVRAENLSYRYNPSGFISEEDKAILGYGPENFNQTSVRNWGLRGDLSFFLGGRRPGSLSAIDREFQRQFSSGFRGLSMTVEPFIGQINFDKSLGFHNNQTLAGIGASIDFGSYLGLRGFYWRGLDNGDVDDIQFVGGEMQFNLSSGEGVVPYLLFGGGYIDVMKGYVGQAGIAPDDKPFAIGGGGLVFPLSSRVKLHAGVRSLLMSGEAIGNISDPNQVQASFMYTGGLKFTVGGRHGEHPDVLRRQTMEDEIARLQIEAAAREALLNNALAASQSRSDSLGMAILIAEARGDSLIATQLRTEQARHEGAQARLQQAALVANEAAQGAAPPLQMPQAVRTATGDRIVTLPLPEEGEVYIRYGAPGGVTIESTFEGTGTNQPTPSPQVIDSQDRTLTDAQIRTIMSETLQEAARAQEVAFKTERDAIQAQWNQAADTTGESRLEERLRILEKLANWPQDTHSLTTQEKEVTGAPDGNELDKIEGRMEERLNQRFDLLLAEIQSPQTGQEERTTNPPFIVLQPAAEGGTNVDVFEQGANGSTTVTTNRSRFQFNHFRPYIGYNISSDLQQFLIGVRGEWQRRFSTRNVRFLPEVLLGFGEGSTMINPNLYLKLPFLNLRNASPYVGAGLGLIKFINAPSNINSFEATLNLLLGTEFDIGGGRFFVEYANVDLGTYNRIGVGYRVQF